MVLHGVCLWRGIVLADTYNIMVDWVKRIKIIIVAMFAIVVIVVAALSAHAKKTAHTNSGSHSKLIAGETGTVARVIDGDSLVLESGLRVAMAGIQAPKPSRYDNRVGKTNPPWPLADQARDTLQALVQGQKIQLFYGGKERDRYDRAVAQVFVLDKNAETGIWLQHAMVKAGMVRVYSWQGHEQDNTALLSAEQDARKNAVGIWDTAKTGGFYDIRKPNPDPLAQYVDSVQIVEGIIVKTADVRGTIYLNFGADYRTDFTIAISKKSRRAFKHADYDPLTLTGAHVRVRGYLELYGGPIIWLNNPNRLEVLD